MTATCMEGASTTTSLWRVSVGDRSRVGLAQHRHRGRVWIHKLKVDLEYPVNIHDTTQDFALAPEPALVTEEMLTPFMRQQWTRLCELRERNEKYPAAKKPLMACRDKKEYVVHFKLLQFYLKMGMKITRIHSVIKYRASSGTISARTVHVEQ